MENMEECELNCEKIFSYLFTIQFAFFHIFHIFSQFNLPFFHIFHIILLFNLLFFHNFLIFSSAIWTPIRAHTWSNWTILFWQSFVLYFPVNMKPSNRQVNFKWDDDEVRFVLDQHAELDFYSASSLKQQSAGRHVAPLGHIILIPSQSVFTLSR
jgi:hypothetical protein